MKRKFDDKEEVKAITKTAKVTTRRWHLIESILCNLYEDKNLFANNKIAFSYPSDFSDIGTIIGDINRADVKSQNAAWWLYLDAINNDTDGWRCIDEFYHHSFRNPISRRPPIPENVCSKSINTSVIKYCSRGAEIQNNHNLFRYKRRMVHDCVNNIRDLTDIVMEYLHDEVRTMVITTQFTRTVQSEREMPLKNTCLPLLAISVESAVKSLMFSELDNSKILHKGAKVMVELAEGDNRFVNAVTHLISNDLESQALLLRNMYCIAVPASIRIEQRMRPLFRRIPLGPPPFEALMIMFSFELLSGFTM